MARPAKKAKKTRAKPGAAGKKIVRNVTYRFPGIDRSGSKAVYVLETKLALTQRQLRVALKRAVRSSLIEELNQQLTPGNRIRLIAQAKLLRAAQK